MKKVILAGGLGIMLLLLSLSGCIWREVIADDEAQPSIIIEDMRILMAIEPPFWKYCPYYGQNNYFPEGETLLVYPVAQSTIGEELHYRLGVRRIKDGWTVPYGTIVWDKENERFIITHPLMGCGCRRRCTTPEIWDYIITLLVYDNLGHKQYYSETIHIVPQHLYYPRGD